MKIAIIAAMSRNRVIGRNNSLPWKLKADLARFKRLTMGHCLLMGRKTFDSIGRPLPGRTTIAITHRPDYTPLNVLVAHSFDEALQIAAEHSSSAGPGARQAEDEIFVAGGEQIYRQALPRASRLYLTIIDHEFEGDAFFPEFDESEWQLVSSESHQPDADNPYPHTFLVYEKSISDK